MLLQDLKPCLYSLSPADQESFFISYLSRRASDLEKQILISTKKSSSAQPKKKKKMISVSPDELLILKKLGLI